MSPPPDAKPAAPSPPACRVEVRPKAAGTELTFDVAATEPVVLHWGLKRQQPEGWQRPPDESWPSGTRDTGGGAVETPVELDADGRGRIQIQVPIDYGFRALSYVLFFPESGHWDNNYGRDYDLLLAASVSQANLPRPECVQRIVERIAAVETGRNSWTLMHRFDACTELLGEAQAEPEALATLFAWLRFSALRQLDWQRRYNTQPRQLTHAQDRLTQRIAQLHRTESHRTGPTTRELARLLLTTVGPGGEGQRIRDDILRIMHRHGIKERGELFVEQWHQKLHNNATPDDLAICDAYLEFLRAEGDHGVFYSALAERGISRKRLRSYDRPIVADPDLPACDHQQLIRDFEDYRALLESIHSATDLQSTATAVRESLGPTLRHVLDELLAGGIEPERPARALRLAARARMLLARRLERTDSDRLLRDLLYLDLALLRHVRQVVERRPTSSGSPGVLVRMIASVTKGLAVGGADAELEACDRHWDRLVETIGRDRRDFALHAKAVTDRLRRWAGDEAQRWVSALQPAADRLGQALGIEPWVLDRFAEEVVRGGPLFCLSQLLRAVDPALRGHAELGAWEIVAPGQASGRLHYVPTLLGVQGKSFDEPVVLVTEAVAGEEEIPPGVQAVVTADTPDLMSHMAVRARNAGVLLVGCLDRNRFDDLVTRQGQAVDLRTTPGGDLVLSAGEAEIRPAPARAAARTQRSLPDVQSCGAYALPACQFTRGLVGAKSYALRELAGRLPDWVRTPAGLALPFGTFGRVLRSDVNGEAERRYQSLTETVDGNPDSALPALRETVLSLQFPGELREEVAHAADEAGLPALEPWDPAWQCIKRVWSSKWTNRAFYARRALGMPHSDLRMAVLVQRIVPADYAYVVHTVNPTTANPRELLAEVVLGLGETLVGNHPGRALGCVCPKPSGSVKLLSYPSKSTALRGHGLIFRSDSNGEDLPGYAGAGLYDTVTLQTPQVDLVDYSQEPLVWDADFRQRLLMRISQLAQSVEAACGAPQDIEGACADGEFFIVQTRPQVGIGS